MDSQSAHHRYKRNPDGWTLVFDRGSASVVCFGVNAHPHNAVPYSQTTPADPKPLEKWLGSCIPFLSPYLCVTMQRRIILAHIPSVARSLQQSDIGFESLDIPLNPVGFSFGVSCQVIRQDGIGVTIKSLIRIVYQGEYPGSRFRYVRNIQLAHGLYCAFGQS